VLELVAMASEAMSGARLRVIDANLNRAGEGLHLLEDVARLMLDDGELTRQLKAMRHEILRGDQSFNQQLVQSRDSEGDVGVDTEVPGEAKERELPIMVVANARRVQESLRILEELSKIPATPKLDPQKFKQARFALYTIEQKMLSRLLRRDKAGRLSGLYAIVDSDTLGKRRHIEVAEELIRGGAKIVQFRDKSRDKSERLAITQGLRELCSRHGALFIVNDYIGLALATDADGLHLGQKDLPVSVARKILPIDKIIGCSVNTVEQAKTAEAEGADYLALGSIYPTSSREEAVVVGLERLRQVKQAVSLPLVAIGGINKDNAAEVLAAGAEAVAVISAILKAKDIKESTRQVIAALSKEVKRNEWTDR
jgi:thiamine-phosphate pyrophosphorylase